MVRHYIVKGRVQGVGFRWFVQRESAPLNLRGRVRNTDEGHVEVLAAGSEEDLERLHACLRRGSRGSRVDCIEQFDRPIEEAENLPPFQIEGAW